MSVLKCNVSLINNTLHRCTNVTFTPLGKAELKPVSLLLTQSHVLLLTEDFSLPLPRFKQGQTPDSKGPQSESIGQGSKSQSKRRGSEIESKRRGSEIEGRGRGLGPDGESQQFEPTDELRLQDVTQLVSFNTFISSL